MKLKNLHIRIEKDLYDEFIKITDASAINRSALIRNWIEEYLGYMPGERKESQEKE